MYSTTHLFVAELEDHAGVHPPELVAEGRGIARFDRLPEQGAEVLNGLHFDVHRGGSFFQPGDLSFQFVELGHDHLPLSVGPGEHLRLDPPLVLGTLLREESFGHFDFSGHGVENAHTAFLQLDFDLPDFLHTRCVAVGEGGGDGEQGVLQVELVFREEELDVVVHFPD